MTRASLLVGIVLLAAIACSDSGGPSDGSPRIVALGPNQVSPGLGPWVIEVRGSGFQDSAEVYVNGSLRETFSGSDTEMLYFCPSPIRQSRTPSFSRWSILMVLDRTGQHCP